MLVILIDLACLYSRLSSVMVIEHKTKSKLDWVQLYVLDRNYLYLMCFKHSCAKIISIYGINKCYYNHEGPPLYI